uniref:Uncharacterized protein n=1 Tax=Meloidogyne enterolobii TaxID=390850 RepID=A0A6V7WGW6_MELEN|nr:unnamed protein product [Meloidogyne enterolobii]
MMKMMMTTILLLPMISKTNDSKIEAYLNNYSFRNKSLRKSCI